MRNRVYIGNSPAYTALDMVYTTPEGVIAAVAQKMGFTVGKAQLVRLRTNRDPQDRVLTTQRDVFGYVGPDDTLHIRFDDDNAPRADVLVDRKGLPTAKASMKLFSSFAETMRPLA